MPLKYSFFHLPESPGTLVRNHRNGKVPNEKRFEREKRIGKQLQGKNIIILTIE